MLKRKFEKAKRKVYKLISRWYDRPLVAATPRESELIKELRGEFARLVIPENPEASPSEREWTANRRLLMQLVQHEDPRDFLRWEVITRTMSINYAEYTGVELRHLKSQPDWGARWAAATVESPTGHPVPHWQYPASSGNLIQHADHLLNFEEKTGCKPESFDFVLEFGGGYGSMCRLFHSLGFAGRYVIYDLPEFVALQRFYLKALGIGVTTKERFIAGDPGVLCLSEKDELEEVLAASHRGKRSLFVATWSISETPLAFRNRFLTLVSQFDAFLIGYQAAFNEIDNVDFFVKWRADISTVDWWDWKIEYIGRHNRYLMGRSQSLRRAGGK
jgi:hypothetical protein